MEPTANGIRKKYDRIVGADRVVRPYKVQRKIEGCTVPVKWCLTAIIKIACGA